MCRRVLFFYCCMVRVCPVHINKRGEDESERAIEKKRGKVEEIEDRRKTRNAGRAEQETNNHTQAKHTRPTLQGYVKHRNNVSVHIKHLQRAESGRPYPASDLPPSVIHTTSVTEMTRRNALRKHLLQQPNTLTGRHNVLVCLYPQA